ncbi:GH39 family glycosyl hydrolase [Massiliimalia massiliensis]|uniref:GH39 family glycosyl hydrolase n=1 Tax=Massiliimalia massiliensis TaxID=1852384 RepID=UPI0013566ED3|nr:hypothetical protein [Massiliimalia massiliensis]
MNRAEPIQQPLAVTVDFSENQESLNFRKLGLYVCTYVDLERILNDIKQIKRLNPRAFRYDPGWGFGNDNQFNSPREIDSPQISGTKDDIKINFSGMDQLTSTLQEEMVDIMYVHAYNPLPLQEKQKSGGNMNENLQMRSNWNTMPEDMEAWCELNRQYAAHWREKGWKVKYYEIWNEPDLQPVFFTGSIDDYLKIYHYGALGVKKGDPDALVGGPAISFDLNWIKPFLDYIEQNELPLDFFSYHAYGEPDKNLRELKEILNGYDRFRNIEILLTEYNSYVPATPDFTENGTIEHLQAAPRILHDFTYFAAQKDIKTVYWAQFNDPEVFGKGVDRCGMLDLKGNPKPSFGAFELLAKFPEKGSRLFTDNESVEGIFGEEDGQYGVLVWNMSAENRKLSLEFKNCSKKEYILHLYKLDENNLVSKKPIKPFDTFVITGSSISIKEDLQPYGVIEVILSEREK